MLKRITIFLYVAVILAMAAATFAEHLSGADFYHQWWFSALWALLTATAIAYFIKQKVKRLSVVLLHLSFVVILIGALLTHLTSHQGIVRLREGVNTNTYIDYDSKVQTLPFTLRLDSFVVTYHEGTRAAQDYQSYLTLTDTEEHEVVSMNNILSKSGTRLYQSSFDPDGHGSTLSLNSDPWGIPVTYLGYALLFVSLVWMLIDPRGAWRQLLRSPLLKKSALTLLFFSTLSTNSSAENTVLPKETASEMGRLHVLYNDRICPLQTLAIDFTKKLYGKRSFGEYTAEQVFTGFLFYGKAWDEQPIIRIKNSELRERLGLPKYCSVSSLLNDPENGYLLGPLLEEYYQGANDKLHQEAAKIDDKLMLIMDLRRYALLKVFPFEGTWYSPADQYPLQMEAERQQYMRSILPIMANDAQAGNFTRIGESIQKMQKYQATFGAEAIPSPYRVKAERLYNAVPLPTILFMLCLTMGFVCLALTLMHRRHWLPTAVMILAFATLTLCLALRWIISGTIPLSNGYETMLFMAWTIMLVTLFMVRRFHIMLTFGFLMSGFMLLVSHLSMMDPQIGHLMPVLNSPLLTFHVSIIMMAFALLSLTFLIGLVALFMRREREELALLSQLFLYPALTCMGFGIFIGAIWANVSWGNYWSWDPKETWALITFMVYAVAVHKKSLSFLRSPMAYHIFMVLAFLTILMTYFGVNYVLGGMHSYA